MIITDELPTDAAAIEALLDAAFGPGRFTKTVYKLREGVDPLPELSLVARDADGRLIGSIRYWPVMLGDTPSIMLGPVAIAAEWQGKGVGGELIRRSMARAADLGHPHIILVGDAPYYGRFGFRRDLAESLMLPGPVDPNRFLAAELVPGAMAGVSGLVGKAPVPLAAMVKPMPVRLRRRLGRTA
ncbi:MAG TPA: N-acetyltransferase [Azospirillaceae bacterium]|nr:N-acetyltransferase [Azospirillaceae bacterium]